MSEENESLYRCVRGERAGETPGTTRDGARIKSAINNSQASGCYVREGSSLHGVGGSSVAVYSTSQGEQREQQVFE